VPVTEVINTEMTLADLYNQNLYPEKICKSYQKCHCDEQFVNIVV